MKVSIICFTNKGLLCANKICTALSKIHEVNVFAKFEAFDEEKKENSTIQYVSESLSDFTIKNQKDKNALVFVGAMGIAVRAISAGVNDKMQDAPVIVVDELGQHVIPVLSGHLGGANELAIVIAEGICATPVITTATDLEGCFAVDLFAKEQNLSIVNREGIAKISYKALENRPIRLSIENYPPTKTDVVVTSDASIMNRGIISLCPKEYALGLGCKRGTKELDIENFVLEQIGLLNIRIDQIGAIASIDLKENEEGIIEFSRKYRIPFITYTPEILNKALGEFSESDFVKSKTGVSNVCERSAMLLTRNKGKIILKKTAKDGITMSISKQ